MMKGKTFSILTAAGILTFALGWFLHDMTQRPKQTKDTKVVRGIIDTVSQADTIKSNNFSHKITGRFVLNESNCAGFNFFGHDIILWTNEIACNDPDTLKIRWLSDSTFMTRSTLRINESCPPRVDIYKVVTYDGEHLKLKSIWTGWNDAKDENLELYKQTD